MHHNTSDTSKSQIQGLSTGPITEICNMIDSGTVLILIYITIH